LDTEGIDLLCALLKFDTRSRISSEAALRHSYFLSLGENIHNLPDSELEKVHISSNSQKQTEQTDSCHSWSRLYFLVLFQYCFTKTATNSAGRECLDLVSSLTTSISFNPICPSMNLHHLASAD
ncbi:unnamed protein product, partial [Tetraodon nigroviridis]